MSHFNRLRAHPVFASYFKAVHPLFWWFLFRELCKLPGRLDALGRGDALISITWWGRIDIHYVAGTEPAGYGLISPTRKPWSDPC
ncbi:hypothetical protein HNE_2019 [Hyphomonas neptunium ATCC 15444]|uniref:Uncharacterized protein n=2 Tax=Hyphomonas TaxID=85 RepID=Q0C0M5_HYPNA|nr:MULTISPECIES: hypothetical protein [Hyphomonas]ABI76941.1 hypothetical protein HNE_2019 [Hyphomonas neptunium ATCC 15444]KCZ84013.1 hypothetical protein HHI_17488 [Hyphomonas hirschiana VP5]